MNTYTPFDKPIHLLTVKDLDNIVTNEVAEGQFVEYKSDPPETKKLAKSIASFANAHGGWFFIGVQSKSGNLLAEAVNGFIPSRPNFEGWFREVVKGNLHPSPLFFTKMLELPNSQFVLVCFVPDGQAGPFIHTDGRVYRRRGDSSEPVFESDRHAMDQLYERQNQFWERFDHFCQDDRMWSQGEDKNAWLNLFVQLSPAPNLLFDIRQEAGLERLLQLANQPAEFFRLEEPATSSTGNISFDGLRLGAESVLLFTNRQSGKALETRRPGIELFADGKARIFVPAEYISVDSQLKSERRSSYGSLQDDLEDQVTPFLDRVISTLDDALDSDSLTHLRFFDLPKMTLVTSILYSCWEKLVAHEIKDDAALYPNRILAITLSGFWRHVPFWNHDDWASYVEKFGLPVVNRDSIRFPSDRAFSVDHTKNNGALIAGLVGLATGLPVGLTSNAFTTTMFQNMTLNITQE
jgi:hypothetical protein